MNDSAHLDIFRWTTLDVPAPARFDAWRADGGCAYTLEDDAGVPFDWACEEAVLGPLTFGRHTWLHPSRPAVIAANRSQARINLDSLDVYQFTLRRSGSLTLRGPAGEDMKRPHELFVIDSTEPFQSQVVTGEVIWLAIPRALLPAAAHHLHGQSLTHGVAQLFAEHLLALARALPQLTPDDLPRIAQATTLLAGASVAPRPDVLEQADPVLASAIVRRVRRHIELHLASPDLTPAQICKAVGVSRSRLYQLFEQDGGVMRQIQRQRLELIHQILSNPARPRESIESLASRYGFPDGKHFFRAFKAAFGHTPGETAERAARNREA
ncbi:helix-turn-helix domain-containing protein [Burkholderia sp. FERM BP-3421]|jgi:AraC-like DNA-binding protein|uniref:helix-turn-helix domain-containing protein n=1 Tax=Burkholderia sp. FERM BP-3421 TaxID=1494466 RepID=UPI002362A9C2|nr:helix-turn-helix domain-containing protein [Burkholderia sp. FERM BP-3421]WDD91372.1 helix-turn-helix domain-containing protein [Burkholderia sp. FERM BP-3421]